MATDEQVKDFAEYLGSLPDAEREQALEKAKVFATANAPDENVGQPPVRTLGEYLAQEIPEPPALVNPGQVVRGAITATTAPGGKGKTVLSMNRFLRWGVGLPLFDGLHDCQVPVQPLKTIIIENEGAAGFFQARIQRLLDGLEYDDAETKLVKENVMIWGDGGWSPMKINDPENMELVKRAAEMYEPDIIFFEPFRGLHTANENDNSEMAVVLDQLNGLASVYDCAVMLTHHERKSGVEVGEDPMNAARGAAVLTDLAGVVERFRAVKAGALRELSWSKWRFADPYAPIRMRFDAARWRYEYVPMSQDETDCLKVFEENPDQWLSVADAAELLSETEADTRKMLNSLAGDGRLKKQRNPLGQGFHYRSAAGGAPSGGMSFD